MSYNNRLVIPEVISSAYVPPLHLKSEIRDVMIDNGILYEIVPNYQPIISQI